MKSFAKNFMLLLAVISIISLGCASNKKTVAEEQKPTERAAKNTKTAQESAITKSTVQDKTMDEMVKKYSIAKQVDKGARAAPDFTLQDINYDMYSLSSYKGQQPVLLFFWQSQCDYCKTEMVMLHNRYPQLVKDGLELLAIDVGESMDTVSDFIRNRGIGFKVLVDTDTSVANSYRTIGVPTYILVDINGNIVFQDNTFPDAYKELVAK